MTCSAAKARPGIIAGLAVFSLLGGCDDGSRDGVGGGSGGGSNGGVTAAGGGMSSGGTASGGGTTGAGGTTAASSAKGRDGSSSTDSASETHDGGLDGQREAGSGTGGEASVRLQGRIDATDATKPGFSWSGSAMFARFQGTGASLRIDGSPNQFAVIIDGTVISPVLKVIKGTTQYALATGLAPGIHDLVVWKRTEGNQGPNRFLGLDITGGGLQAPPAAPERRIEVYGDSISAGYGLDGPDQNCAWSPDTENHYLTYAAITSRELGADLHVIAWSGIGMYRNFGMSDASLAAMPYVYARTIADQSSSTWGFASWQPHVVIVNLGTNDASTIGDPGTPYETAYLGFLRALRQKYAETFFVLTIGPMLDGSNLTAIRGHIQKVMSTRGSEGDTKLSYLEFPVQQQSDGLGCDWHPSAKTHAKMANLLTAELRTRLGW
jgi:lysophospholipase L1-like esterase